MTYDEALNYIHGISWTFCKPGLERISELCNALGNPQNELRFIHVAGTNGKGSTSVMLSEILKSAGYKVGLFTSPYVYRFNERMRVDGKEISDEMLAEVTEHVKPAAEAMADKPTEFELITAIAFEYFRREGCDAVVLEAGMGGRLDSTNVIRNPLISIITGIALDHTAFLGDTVEKIAAEKAGIIKDFAPVLYGGSDESAYDVIRNTAQERGSEIYRPNYSDLKVKEMNLDFTEFDFGGYESLRIRLLGSYQPRNAALVVEAVRILKKRGLSISPNAVREGLLNSRWRARFEILHSDPMVIFDGAHNPEGISVATESIKRYFGEKKVVIFTGVLRDKDYGFIAERLAEIADKAFTITPDNPRALTANEYAEVLKKNGVDATACDGIADALRQGMAAAKDGGTALCCLGSLYTYSDVSKCIENML